MSVPINGCVFADLDFDQKRCPCANGFICDDTRRVCVSELPDAGELDSRTRIDAPGQDVRSDRRPLDGGSDGAQDSGPDTATDVPPVDGGDSCVGAPSLTLRLSFSEATGSTTMDEARGVSATMVGADLNAESESPCGTSLSIPPGLAWLDVDDDSELDMALGSDHTISVWVRAETEADSMFPAILSKESGAVRTGPNLLVRNTLTTEWLYNPYIEGRSFSISGVTEIDNGPWTFLVVTRGGDTIVTYTDGRPSLVATIIPASNQNTHPLRIGGKTHPDRSPPSLETRFAGEVDELRVYDRALSAAEVAALYTSQSSGDCGCR